MVQNTQEVFNWRNPNEQGFLSAVQENDYCSKRDLIKLNLKYKSKGRFELGYATVGKKNVNTKENLPHTIVMPPFNYLSKVIISISDYEIKKNIEIFQVKKLLQRLQWYKIRTKMKSTKITPLTP